ncbi:MAG: diphthine--ammonia ligase [Nanoarchaeota archaeon]
MCGIIGAFNIKNAFKIVKDGLIKTINRGKDNHGYYDFNDIYYGKINEFKKTISKNVIGHNLHAIVNNIPQPIKYKNSVITSNCEIYNWNELSKKYSINSKNDSDLLLKLLNKLKIKKALKELRGVYSFCYIENNKVYLARDIIGIKPLWYIYEEKKLIFASEKKAIEKYGNVKELNPREIIEYDLKTNKIKIIKRNFIKLKKIDINNNCNNNNNNNNNNTQDNLQKSIKKLKQILIESIKIRIPDKKHKFGLLFSGGIDSVIIAKILKDLDYDFNCYVCGFSKDSKDIIYAKKIAKELNLKLKIITLKKEKLKETITKVINLVEDNNVIKVGVSLPLYLASKLAKKDKCKVIFSGIGADEIFAGYQRYKQEDLNKINYDCYSDLLKIYEKNTYRDDVITMNNNLELRIPYLDKKLVKFALNINPKLKIKKEKNVLINKYILRKLALNLGILKETAYRKKVAAQYGSGFDKAIKKCAKENNYKNKSEFLKTFNKKTNLNLAALISSGKDGLYATYIMQKQNYKINCIISLKSINQDSYMFHTPNIDLVKLQSKAMNTPLIFQETTGRKEEELKDLKKAIKKAKEKYNIDGIITGALYSNYQRERIEKICDELGLKCFSPLWHINQEQEIKEILKNNFKIIFSSVAALGFNEKWLNKIITLKEIEKLIELNKKYKINVAGEGGEYESLVLDCPMFNKQIKLKEYEIIKIDEYNYKLNIKKAILEDK